MTSIYSYIRHLYLPVETATSRDCCICTIVNIIMVFFCPVLAGFFFFRIIIAVGRTIIQLSLRILTVRQLLLYKQHEHRREKNPEIWKCLFKNSLLLSSYQFREYNRQFYHQWVRHGLEFDPQLLLHIFEFDPQMVQKKVLSSIVNGASTVLRSNLNGGAKILSSILTMCSTVFISILTG